TAMQTEFQTKYQDFLENEANYSDLIKQSKQRELGNLQERITEFQESAQQDLVQRENKLLQPIIDQARDAIEEVAEEQGYTYVFDMSAGSLLYANPGDDILPLVKDKLGIEGDATPATLPSDTMGNP
ncbi:MAG: OmpH family outer membrane protein, partial [Bacteroidota bacterium]